MSFDAIGFLEKYNVKYKKSGASRGWVNIQCPFPDCNDHNGHMGVKLSDGHCYCWICKRGGKVEFVVKLLLGIPYHQAIEICREFRSDIFDGAPQETTSAERVEIRGMLPLQQRHIEYLNSRGFDAHYLEQKYNLKCCGTVGRFPYSIVIPAYEDGLLVSSTSRDITGTLPQRYLALRDEESIVPIKNCVYNIDNLNENILIVEGPTDVWRIGGSTGCLFGTEFTPAQVMRVASRFPKNVYVLFDPEEMAQRQANKFAAAVLSLGVPHVEVIEFEDVLNAEDPGELTPDQALSIRNELGL